MKNFPRTEPLKSFFVQDARSRVGTAFDVLLLSNYQKYEKRAIQHEVSMIVEGVCDEYEKRATGLVLLGAIIGAWICFAIHIFVKIIFNI